MLKTPDIIRGCVIKFLKYQFFYQVGCEQPTIIIVRGKLLLTSGI